MRIIFAALALSALAACQTAPPAAPDYQLRDLTAAFTTLHDGTTDLPPEARVAAFRAEIEPLFPDFYGEARFEGVARERLDRRISAALERFPQEREAYERAAANFTAMLEPAITGFRAAYPDLGAVGDVYVLHSLGEMDGGLREVDGRIYFIFGADMIGRVHAPGSERPFFHHELYHLYMIQAGAYQGCAQLWCSLWSEGAAVRAAHELNPDASDSQLLLTQPEPMRAAVEANLREAVCAVRARLDSEEAADFNALFGFERFSERLPPRFGYFVGYLAARETGMSPREMAHLSAEQARPALEAALARLADCAP